MKFCHKTNNITMRWMLASLCIITIVALLLQPATTGYAKGRGPDPGRDRGPDPGVDGPRD